MIGVATSISALRNYDLNDTIAFLSGHQQFDSLQVFLNQKLLDNSDELIHSLDNLLKKRNINLYFHLDYSVNTYLTEHKTYIEACAASLAQLRHRGVIFHFDATIPLTRYSFIFEYLNTVGIRKIWVENYYHHNSQTNSQFQIDSYKSLFALYNSRFNLGAVLDIPRLFHAGLQLPDEEAIRETNGILAFMKSQNIPVMLHLIDVTDPLQERRHFCTLGEGILPYSQIFSYMGMHNIEISDIILEFEDKIKPIESIKFLKSHNMIKENQ